MDHVEQMLGGIVIYTFIFMFPSILTFHFDLILRSFLGWRNFSKTLLGSNQNAEKLLFSALPSIITFNFDLVICSFWAFLGQKRLIWDSGFHKTVMGYTYVVEQALFSMFPSILTFDFT